MNKSTIAQRVFLLIVFVLLSGCGGGNPNVQVNELSNSATSYDESIYINNCGGKADSEQTASRSFASSFDSGAEIKIGYQIIIEGGISAKYSQYKNVTKSMRLIAPPRTNMEFILRWSEEVRAGNIVVDGSQGTYEVRVPLSVAQISSQDLGGCDGGVIELPKPTAAINPPSSGNDGNYCGGLGTCWVYDDSARIMTWTGATDGSEDIWQGNDESLQKIRDGYTAIFTTSVSGAFINTCILTVNGTIIKTSCDTFATPYTVQAGAYQVTSKSPPGYPTNGGFRWSTK